MKQTVLDLIQQSANQLDYPLYFMWWNATLMQHAELEGIPEPSSDELRDPDMDVLMFPYKFICSTEEIQTQELEGAEHSQQQVFHPDATIISLIHLTPINLAQWFELPEHDLNLKTWMTETRLYLLTFNGIPKAVCQSSDPIGMTVLKQTAEELYELYAPKKPDTPMTYKNLLRP